MIAFRPSQTNCSQNNPLLIFKEVHLHLLNQGLAKREFQILRIILGRYIQAMKALQSRVNELEFALKQLKNEKDILQSRNNHLNQENVSISQKNKQLEHLCCELSQQNSDIALEFERNSAIFLELEENLKNKIQEQDQTIQEKQLEIEEFNQQMNQFTEKLNQIEQLAREEKEELLIDNQNLSFRVTQLEEEVQLTTTYQRQLEATIQSKNDSFASFKNTTKLLTLDAEVKPYQLEAQLMYKSEDCKIRYKQLIRKIQAKEKELRQMNEQYQRKQDQNMKRKIDQVGQELAKLQNEEENLLLNI